MRKSNRILQGIACASILVMWNAANGSASELICPASANANNNVAVTLTLENSGCAAEEFRIISSIVGNAGATLAGIGIFGPVVVEPVVIVPAGTGVNGCGCSLNSCQCDNNSCTTDADCASCEAVTPGTLVLTVSVEPALPNSLGGTVATLLLVSEPAAGSDAAMSINSCFVEVL